MSRDTLPPPYYVSQNLWQLLSKISSLPLDEGNDYSVQKRRMWLVESPASILVHLLYKSMH